MICPKCQSDTAIRNGGGRGYCRAGDHTFHLPAMDQAERDEAELARKGWQPNVGLTTPLPVGQKLRGTSTLIDKRTGESVLQWVKSNEDAERAAVLQQAIVDALCERVPTAKRVPLPTARMQAELLNQYTITDYHLGMLAWHEETGADWDTDIAENLLVAWFARAIRLAPAAAAAVFAQLGDFLHWDGFDAVTPAHKNLLDADTRFPKLVRVAIRAIRRIIAMLLEKYAVVYILMAEGNHDPASSVFLREMMHAFYEDDPRVIVETSPDPYYCIEHGACALLYHHGHMQKPEQLDATMVAKFREVFGRTKFAYAHMGHKHSDKRLETKLMIVEQHRTLAAPDAYASRGGWMSGRDAKVITYHKRFGEVGRVTISPDMVAAAAA
jgi:hypothetical protein